MDSKFQEVSEPFKKEKHRNECSPSAWSHHWECQLYPALGLAYTAAAHSCLFHHLHTWNAWPCLDSESGGRQDALRQEHLFWKALELAADQKARGNLSSLSTSGTPVFWRCCFGCKCSSYSTEAAMVLGVGDFGGCLAVRKENISWYGKTDEP